MWSFFLLSTAHGQVSSSSEPLDWVAANLGGQIILHSEVDHFLESEAIPLELREQWVRQARSAAPPDSAARTVYLAFKKAYLEKHYADGLRRLIRTRVLLIQAVERGMNFQQSNLEREIVRLSEESDELRKKHEAAFIFEVEDSRESAGVYRKWIRSRALESLRLQLAESFDAEGGSFLISPLELRDAFLSEQKACRNFLDSTEADGASLGTYFSSHPLASMVVAAPELELIQITYRWKSQSQRWGSPEKFLREQVFNQTLFETWTKDWSLVKRVREDVASDSTGRKRQALEQETREASVRASLSQDPTVSLLSLQYRLASQPSMIETDETRLREWIQRTVMELHETATLEKDENPKVAALRRLSERWIKTGLQDRAPYEDWLKLLEQRVSMKVEDQLLTELEAAFRADWIDTGVVSEHSGDSLQRWDVNPERWSQRVSEGLTLDGEVQVWGWVGPEAELGREAFGNLVVAGDLHRADDFHPGVFLQSRMQGDPVLQFYWIRNRRGGENLNLQDEQLRFRAAWEKQHAERRAVGRLEKFFRERFLNRRQFLGVQVNVSNSKEGWFEGPSAVHWLIGDDSSK